MLKTAEDILEYYSKVPYRSKMTAIHALERGFLQIDYPFIYEGKDWYVQGKQDNEEGRTVVIARRLLKFDMREEKHVYEYIYLRDEEIYIDDIHWLWGPTKVDNLFGTNISIKRVEEKNNYVYYISADGEEWKPINIITYRTLMHENSRYKLLLADRSLNVKKPSYYNYESRDS